jgi:hypothetical protein
MYRLMKEVDYLAISVILGVVVGVVLGVMGFFSWTITQ